MSVEFPEIANDDSAEGLVARLQQYSTSLAEHVDRMARQPELTPGFAKLVKGYSERISEICGRLRSERL